MFSTHDNRSRSLWAFGCRHGLCIVCIVAAMVLIGCQSKSRPFGDVTAKSQQEPTAIATADQAPAQPAAGQAQPPAPLAPPAADQAPPAPVVTPATPALPATAAVAPAETAAPKALPGPAEVDRIGARRDWPRSAAMRPSGGVTAWPLYYPDPSIEKRGDLVEFFFDPAEYVLNTVLTPVRMFITPPWTKVEYSEVGDEGWQPVEQRVIVNDAP